MGNKTFLFSSEIDTSIVPTSSNESQTCSNASILENYEADDEKSSFEKLRKLRKKIHRKIPEIFEEDSSDSIAQVHAYRKYRRNQKYRGKAAPNISTSDYES